MIPNKPVACPPRSAGFTLPAVLVVVSALLIMVIGLLAMSGIERKTARSYVDLQRADMAAMAGLEQVKAVLNQEAANDDFLIVADVPPLPNDADKALDPASYLYLARGEKSGISLKYRYQPLFSTISQPDPSGSALLDPPEASALVGDDPKKIETVPWSNPALASWIPIKAKKNGQDQTVARYAYWVEDLQGKINPKIAGKKSGVVVRNEYPFPAPGVNPKVLSEDEPALSGIAVDALNPQSTDDLKASISAKIIDGRDLMVSPDSMLAASGYAPPLKRGDDGLLGDPVAAVLEKNFSPVIHSYEEKPQIPFSPGIDPKVMGLPKLNLNKLLSQPREGAINDFAAQIDNALPNFKDRKGGFNLERTMGRGNKDDYLKTLAANALDYADADSLPTVKLGDYRGIDGAPFLSEVVLSVDYTGHTVNKVGNLALQFTFTLYVELWNMTNQNVSGNAQVSYEAALNLKPSFGAAAGTLPGFDEFLEDKDQSQHNLVIMNGRHFTMPQLVSLLPDEYKMYKMATVKYTIDVGSNHTNYKDKFSLQESKSDVRGMSLLWNNAEVERLDQIDRDPFGMLDFVIQYPRSEGKAAIPGHTYGPYGEFYNNMGDPRMSHYFRTERLAENAFPGNVSPNRRNVRIGTIYGKSDGPDHRFHFGRVLPSEWPDRGHDSNFSVLPVITDPQTDFAASRYASGASSKVRENAPQRISNAGRFYSATELGNVYDPVMWFPRYDDIKDKPGSGNTDNLSFYKDKYPTLPATRNVWPDVGQASTPSNLYGGGNTLRIGRYEHARFDGDNDGMRAAYLLDLFHTGKSTSDSTAEREGDVVTIAGQININTASKDSLRAMAAGTLKQDPQLRKITTWNHNASLVPTSQLITLGTPTRTQAADLIAEAIIARRPFSSMGQFSAIKDKDLNPVFGNSELYVDQKNILWTDAAAEEIFARIHDASTLRSRNFRVWVIGQSITGSESAPEILAETRKVFTVFADPGERNASGEIDPSKSGARVTYENNF